jgi:hypothetical protein
VRSIGEADADERQGVTVEVISAEPSKQKRVPPG